MFVNSKLLFLISDSFIRFCINSSPEIAKTSLETNVASSYESSPKSGPSRSASLRVKAGDAGPRVTFSDTQTMGR